MEFQITQLDYVTDRLRGVRKNMRGYVIGVVCEYLGHNLYEVELEGYGTYMLYDWQISVI